MLGYQAEHTVKRVLGKSLTTSYIKLKAMPQTSIIYLDCGDFHIVEGSHNFKLWIYMGLPSEKMTDYSLSELTHNDLTVRFPNEFSKNLPNGKKLAIQHSPTSWQKNAIDFLTENGVELDLEKLFDSDKYRRYVNRYGLPVVKKNTQENNLLEVNLLKALDAYQPITAKELVKILDNEFTMFADRPTVNAKLYSMLSQKKVTRDDSFRWYLAG